jgi:hypothetical protein
VDPRTISRLCAAGLHEAAEGRHDQAAELHARCEGVVWTFDQSGDPDKLQAPCQCPLPDCPHGQRERK